MFEAVYSAAVSHGHFQHFLSVLHHLLIIPSDSVEFGRNLWIMADNAVASTITGNSAVRMSHSCHVYQPSHLPAKHFISPGTLM